jgi:hypothetical protein
VLGRTSDMQFAAMLNRKETLKLKDLEGGFSDGRTISMAYSGGRPRRTHRDDLR